MHISNDLYFRDRERHDLALRMIRHEARTCTIRSCTGLTDDRIRRLFKTYLRQQPCIAVRRRRGKSPRQVAFFTRNPHLQFEASLLNSVFAAFGLLHTASPAAADNPSIEYGELFCDAYETHRQLLQTTRISFEHAWFLLQLLTRGGALSSARCRHCSGRYLRDCFSVVMHSCPACELKADAARPPRQMIPANRDRAAAPGVSSGKPGGPTPNSD